MDERIRTELVARVREMIDRHDNSNERILGILVDILTALESPVYA